MTKGKLYITLNSDLCVGDGSVYNSSIDTDVCKDSYGLPYIPAKRLRGCLRECAEELSDWGMDIKAEKLFGTEGNQRAAVRIGNAYIEGYEEYVREIKANPGLPLFHPQNVLNQFAYIRTQTAIDNNTGAADETTLRTIRVINRGLAFVAEVVFFEDDTADEVTKQLNACCSVLRHMGIARTRGYGEVTVRFTSEDAKGVSLIQNHAAFMDGADKLVYTLELLDPMILKSINGGEENTQDYIEGSKVLGLVAQAMNEKNENVASFLSGKDLFFSNAYISENGERFKEVPATVYSVKNHKEEYRNKLFDSKENRDTCDKDLQLNQMKHCYIAAEPDGKIKKLDVDIEERYHHRRPADKAIGRASAKEDSNSDFYQISSISAGQIFMGMILGTPDEIKKVYDILSAKEYVYMGYGRSSEYGLAKIRITKVEKQAEAVQVSGTDFAVKLESPTIIYNENAYYSINSADLIEEIKAALGIDCEASEKYMNYVTIGGYNVTWNRRKPTIDAFGAGTVIRFHSDKEVCFSAPEVLKIGERNREGFGEATLLPIDLSKNLYVGSVVSENVGEANIANVDVNSYPFAEMIGCKLFESFIRAEAANHAGDYFNKNKGESIKPTISNLALMNKELLDAEDQKDSFETINIIAEKRYGKNSERKKEKLKQAKDLLKKANEGSNNLITEFSNRYHLDNFKYDQDILFLRYLEAFLMHGKYMLHSHSKQIDSVRKEAADEQ